MCMPVSVCAFATLNEEEQLLIVAGFDKGKHICQIQAIDLDL